MELQEVLMALDRRTKLVYNVLKIISWILLISVAGVMIMAVLAVTVDGLLPYISDLSNGMVPGKAMLGDTELSKKQITLLNLGYYALQCTFFYLLIRLLLMKSIGKMLSDNSPFSREISQKIRKAAYISFLILLLTINLFAAVIAFVLLLFLSSLFEYGAYLQEKADETSRIQEEMIVSFAEITENKSAQTGHHVRRVAEYSWIIAKQMGLDSEDCERIRLASTMHDIGKLLIPANILEKPGRLTDEEFTEIKKHSGYGGELLENVEGDIMGLARTIALDHHERPDGRGYPKGKKLEEISLAGRIVAVADVYDALTSKRSYKDAWDPHKAYAEIAKNAGGQFDEAVVTAFKVSYSEIERARQKYADGKDLSFKPTAPDKEVV